jgi:CRP-like cAMP-binding protein
MYEYTGSVVHVYESGRDSHPGFGELSLLYSKPRGASIFAITDSTLWYLDKNVFQRIVVRSIDSHKLMKRILRKVKLFSCLSLEQIRKIVGLLTVAKYSAGEYITNEGVKSENFYVILNGEVESRLCADLVGDPERDAEFLILKKDDHFGEYSLLSTGRLPRRSIKATGDVKVLVITRETFESHLGIH